MPDKYHKYRNLCYTVPGIKQATEDTCWCAALAWWAKAHGNSRPNLGKDEIYFRYATHAVGGWQGSNLITPAKYKIVLSETIWKASPQFVAKGFGPQFLDSKLENGPIIIGYWYPSGGHVVVMVAPSITHRSDNKYMVMDPAFGSVRAYGYGRFSTYSTVLIATPR